MSNVLLHKANTTLTFLQCSLKPCSSHIKAKCYLSYIKPIVEYSYTNWDPYIKKDTDKLEMEQRRQISIELFYYKL